uniref:hypothetical protein n=1 Tax=Methylobacterium sp. B34 TaxID=95563 RepID=UPI0003493121|nr:hypothetical protein [Methylobacterium sp. B34]
MPYVTIEKDGQPWWLCNSTQAGDVDYQKDRDAVHFPNSTFSARLATPAESEKVITAIHEIEANGGDRYEFFAIPASEDVRRQMDEADARRSAGETP